MKPYRIEAYNTAKESENKMHDDTVARRFGFVGGLVPGVDVYAYMTHLPVEQWGGDFLARGVIDCRFLKPVYDGEAVSVTATERDGGLELAVTSRGEICATGHASLPQVPAAVPGWAASGAAPAAEARPPADEASLAAGMWLGIRPFDPTPEWSDHYLRDVRESAPLYRRDGIVHPGQILRAMNWALGHNVVLGPWIHVGSTVQNLAPAALGEPLTARAVVTGNYDRKGHRFVELDGVVFSGVRPVARIAHTAIYRPRQAAAAA